MNRKASLKMRITKKKLGQNNANMQSTVFSDVEKEQDAFWVSE